MADFHKDRLRGIGGSDIPVIVLGKHYNKTAYDLFLEKTGQIPTPDIDTPDTRRGKRQEPIAANLYAEKTGKELKAISETIWHPKHKFMLAHIDRLIMPEENVLEIKCPRVTTFRKWQLEGIPEGIQLQGQHYIEVLKAKKVVFCVFCAELDDIFDITIKRDDELIDLIVDSGQRFWSYVEAGEYPRELIHAEPDPIKLPKIGGQLQYMEGEAWQKAALALREAQEIKKEAEALEEDAKGKIRGLMGDEFDVVEGIISDDESLRVYNRLQAGRDSFDWKRLMKDRPEMDFKPYLKHGQPFKTFKFYFTRRSA